MQRLLTRCTPSLAVALVALFVALAGTAAAAVLITGDDVVDGSLTGADLAARTIGSRELRDVGTAFETLGTDQIVGTTTKTVGELALPPGVFVLNVNAIVTGSSSATSVADCRLLNGLNGVIFSRRSVMVSTAAVLPITLSRVLTIRGGGSLKLVCERAGGTTNFTISDVSLNAVRVAGVQR